MSWNSTHRSGPSVFSCRQDSAQSPNLLVVFGSDCAAEMPVPAMTKAAAIRMILYTVYSRLPDIQPVAGNTTATPEPYGNPSVIRNHIVRIAGERYRARKTCIETAVFRHIGG